MRVRRLLVPVLTTLLVSAGPLEALALEASATSVTEIRLLPRLAGVRVLIDGRTYVSDDRGRVALPAEPSERVLRGIRVPTQEVEEGMRVRQGRWFPDLQLALDVDREVRFSFTDRNGARISPEGLTIVEIKSSVGGIFGYSESDLTRPHWLHAQRVVSLQAGLRVTPIEYSIQRVVVRGGNVVNESQQRFDPNQVQDVRIWLLYFPARFTVRDAVFGFPLGWSLTLDFADGRRMTLALENGRASVPALPRGQYDVSVDGPGITLSVPLALSRPQDAEIMFLSYFDLLAAGLVLVSFLVGLPLLGRLRRGRALIALEGGMSRAAARAEDPDA